MVSWQKILMMKSCQVYSNFKNFIYLGNFSVSIYLGLLYFAFIECQQKISACIKYHACNMCVCNMWLGCSFIIIVKYSYHLCVLWPYV